MLAACGAILCACQKEFDYYNSATTEPVATIDEDQLVIDGKSESAKISIASNMWWKAHVEYESGETEQWCILTPDKGFGDIDIDVTCTRNYKLDAKRSAKIIIEGDDQNTSFRKEFIIVQNNTGAYIEIGLEGDGANLDVPIISSENTITVKSNSAWEASSDQEWCKVEGTGASGEGSLKVSCTTNATKAIRKATVTVSGKGSDVKRTFLVTQSDEFGVTVVEVEKTPSSFKASWTPVVGAADYQVIIKKVDGSIATIDAGQATDIDLAADPLFAEPQYAGYVAISVKTISEDPAVYSESNSVESNSHFTSGKGTSADPFIIGEYESLKNITKANKVLPEAYYKLNYAPSMDGFKPICTKKDPFQGIFDGNGKTISSWNPTVMADEGSFGFFVAVGDKGKVSNLKFSGSKLSLTMGDGKPSSSDGIGFAAGINAGTVENISLSNCSIETEAGTSPVTVGGIAGQNSGKISSCSTSGGRISAAANRNKSDEFNCGGIAGSNSDKGVIENCTNGNDIIGMNIIGGIAGYSDGQVIGCGNSGRITANYYFGGIVGYVKTTGNSTFKIKNCYNTGTIVMDEPAGASRGAAYVGGITSRIHSTGTAIENCYSSGDMIIGSSTSSSSLRIGGLVGHVNNKGTMNNCYFSGTVTISGKVNYGGIVGEFADKATKIVNCYSVGKVQKTDSASGNINDAFGSCAKSAVITACYALANGGAKFISGTTTNVDAESGYRTESQLKDQSTFTGWDFSKVWKMNGYPQLISNPEK